MNRKEIIAFITNPSSLKEENLSHAKELAIKFPYSGIAQSIYAKALHNCDDTEYNEQLKTAAIVCSDRKKLYLLIHQSKLRELINTIEEETKHEVLPQENIPQKETSSTHESVETKLVETEEKKSLPSPLTSEEKNRELDELERNILSQAINSTIQLEAADYKDVIKEKEISSIKEKEEETEIAKTKFSNWFGIHQTTPKEKKSEKKKGTSGIIRSFLNKENTKENRPEFFSPTNIAKISSVDNEEFVTETLASVYAAQGNFEKAIRIYERLSLINPEKNTFFASRIRFLKEKLDNKRE